MESGDEVLEFIRVPSVLALPATACRMGLTSKDERDIFYRLAKPKALRRKVESKECLQAR